MKKKIAAIVLTALVAITIATLHNVPNIIMNRARSVASSKGVEFDAKNVEWSVLSPLNVEFKDATVRAPFMTGKLTLITMRLNTSASVERVHVSGGDMHVTSIPTRTGDDRDGRRRVHVTVNNVHAIVDNPYEGCDVAEMFGLEFDDGAVRAKRATMTCKNVMLEVDDVKGDIADKTAYVKTMIMKWREEKVRMSKVTMSKSENMTIAAEHVEWNDLSVNNAYVDMKIPTMNGAKAVILASDIEWGHPIISRSRVTVRNVSMAATYEKTSDGLSLSAFPLTVNGLTFRVNFLESGESWEANMELLKADCQDVLGAVPDGVKPMLTEMEMGGTIQGSIVINRRHPNVDVDVNVENRCRVSSTPPDLTNVTDGKRFKYTVYDPKGIPAERTGGVGSPGWTPIANISPYMVLAVITMEDPSFQTNNGFDICAIENSIRDNIKERKFKRGASTISMQLAKNVWLGREKTVSRKVQEAFLTVLLEQKLEKSQIMELYLNSVEFGPNTYGISAATRRYFKKSPRSLTLAESVFLASILPKPNGVYFNSDGTLHKGRRNYLNLVIELMLRKGMITDEEARAGKTERVTRGDKDTVSDVDMSGWDVY